MAGEVVVPEVVVAGEEVVAEEEVVVPEGVVVVAVEVQEAEGPEQGAAWPVEAAESAREECRVHARAGNVYAPPAVPWPPINRVSPASIGTARTAGPAWSGNRLLVALIGHGRGHRPSAWARAQILAGNGRAGDLVFSISSQG